MKFTDIPDDTLDDKDFEEIDDDNYYLILLWAFLVLTLVC